MTRRALLHTLSALLAAVVTRPAAAPVREESGDWAREHFNRRRYHRVVLKNGSRLYFTAEDTHGRP